MKEKPILFNTEMVKAILDGRKTVTRRVIKRDLLLCCDFDTDGTICGCRDKDGDWYEIEDFAPYQIDDTLYVRECFAYKAGKNPNKEVIYRADAKNDINKLLADCEGRWKPSIHMPKEAARIWLKGTNVRVERLQDITPKQAGEEGVTWETDNSGLYRRMRFKQLWDSTIKKQDLDKYGWDANPYVWVIEFERIENEN